MVVAMSLIHARFRAVAERAQEDRGDVPGWVLITLMTAGVNMTY